MVERQTSFERNLGSREKYCDLLIPREPNGDIQYETLGKILTAKSLEEVLCASYVDPKFGRKLDVSGVPDTEWEYITVTEDVVILRKYNHKTKINCFMGRGLVNAPLNEVQMYIGHYLTRYDYDPMVTEIKIVRALSESDSIAYMAHRVEKFWGLLQSQRDTCFFARQAFVNDSYVQTSISVEDVMCPEREGFTRMELLPGCGWVLEPFPGDSSKTIVNYLAHMNLGGLMPPMLVNMILKKQPLVIARVRDIFEKKAKGLYQSQHLHRMNDDSLDVIFGSRPSSSNSAGSNKSNHEMVDSDVYRQGQVYPLYREPLIFDSSDSFPSQKSPKDKNFGVDFLVESDRSKESDGGVSSDEQEERPSLFKRITSWIWTPAVSTTPQPAQGYYIQPLPNSTEPTTAKDSDNEMESPVFETFESLSGSPS